jgi:hypothetical protein
VSSAQAAKRRAVKLEATPKWLTTEMLTEIETIYFNAQGLTELTGIDFHIDHRVPLQGEEILGLHVPWNLQILTQHENCSKSNRYEMIDVESLGVPIDYMRPTGIVRETGEYYYG